ncbi:MAG: SDR family oxidoreductase [Candidatus Latescibacteria bacterium]|nr:SDR family oxidoreductase [Candidatus Latescibacterota bacterium]
MDLAEGRIIVTGAASGMGAYFAVQLAAAGAQVAAGDVDGAALEALAVQNEGLPGRIHTRPLDVSLEEETVAFVEWAGSVMGGLNGLLNNAGILRDGLLVKRDRDSGRAVKLDRDQWQAVVDVNLTGATWMVRDAVAYMVDHPVEEGVVVNLSSLSRHGNFGQSNYVAAKAALAANTVTWAREFARFGVRVGALAPGMVDTPMTQAMPDAARKALVERIPLGRIGDPYDIWLGVKFILENSYFTGRCLDIDGGLTM